MIIEILPSGPIYCHSKWYILFFIMSLTIGCAPMSEKQKSIDEDEMVLSKGLAILADPDATDKSAAFIEFKKACLLGNNYGCHKVGIAYNNGLYGKEKNYQQAKQWYEKAAHNRYVPSQLNIANIYAYRLLPLDDTAGYSWLVLAREGLRTCVAGSIEAESDTSDIERQRMCKTANSNYRNLLGIFRKRMTGEEMIAAERSVLKK
jgi:TPR repeat protein